MLHMVAFLCLPSLLHAQSQTMKAVPNTDNDLVRSSHSGQLDATRELTRRMFRNMAIPSDVADSLGFTDRVTAAEVAYRRGDHSGVNETDIIKAVNNMANNLGVPEWVKTNVDEVRMVRMHLVATIPNLAAYQGPPDAKGRYPALSGKMSPLEAGYVVTKLLYQKAFNAEFQVSEKERVSGKLTDAQVYALHMQRTETLQSMLQGRTQALSVRDLLTASDMLFNDVQMPSRPSSSTIAQASSHLLRMGGR